MNKLLKEFNIEVKSSVNDADDYLVFKDKDLLDTFRIKALEKLSDKGFSNKHINNHIINDVIDEVTYLYDLSNDERMHLYNLIDSEVNGFGPITYLMNDGNITEIMINSPSSIYIEVDGVLSRDNSVSFVNDEHIIRTIEKLLEGSGKVIDSHNPMIDARLNDGSRINAIIPPLSKNPIVTIRKFKKNIVGMDDLIGNGTLTPYMARFLETAVRAKLNILVIGGTASGKTTMLNILGNYIPDNERIITIEDVLELNLKQNHVISLETKESDFNFKNGIMISDLVKNSLRMRPDRIIVGEIRGNEVFDVLQAMNIGYSGSLTSLHANGCKEALRKLETMILLGGRDIPNTAIREYINDAIDLIVHITKMSDGRRKIVDISEVVEANDFGYVINNIFKFNTVNVSENGVIQGEFVLQNKNPKVIKKIRDKGINDLDDIFNNKKK